MSSTESDYSAYASAEDESDEEQDKPLPLIEVSITDENDNKNTSLVLNEKSLETVLKSAKGRPISIIAIVGSPKCGKSLILNFIKRGLESKEIGNRSLLGNKTEILTGFPYNTQNSSQNTGIWVWSRAFLIDGDDNDIAVILMDTEGLSDSKASSAILGLSFLSSSILIYTANPEDASVSLFSPLSTYFKYGLCCLEKDEELSEEDPPFQRLIFLFQNWNNPEEYAFGRKGGKSLMEDKLGRLRGRMKVDTREGLNCFQYVASYLFPPLIDGDISTFGGRLCELSEEFDNQLDRFINNLLKEENLQAKKIFGVQLTSTEFSNFLKQYVNMYNDFGKTNEDVISEDLILETTCATFHTNIVSKAVEKYHDIFTKRSKKIKTQNQDDLQSIHETAVRQANLQFKRARKLEGYEKAYEEKLQKELELILQNKLAKTFKSRQDYIDTCFKNAKEKLKSGLSEESEFDPKEAEDLKEVITQEFLENFTSDDEENTLELTSTLETALKDILEPFLEKQSVFDEESAKKDMKNLRKQLVREYRTGMEKMLNENPTYDTETLQNFHSLNLNKIMETFTEVSVNNPFEEKTRTEIENSIQNLYKQTVNNILEIVEEEKSKAEEFITMEVNLYSDLILQYDSSLDLLAIHQNNKQYIMEKFEQHCKFPVGSTEREDFKKKLENALEKVYNQNNILNENNSFAEKPQAKAEKGKVKKVKNIVEECLQQYESDMITLRHGADFLEQIKLTKHHQNTQKKALSAFEKMANGTNDGALENLKTRLNTEFNRIIIENERLIELAQANAKNWIHECLKEYQLQMKGSADYCTSPKEFQQAHEKVKKNIVGLFGKKWKYNCNKSFRQEHEKNLELELDATFEEMEDFFKMKINSDVVSAEDLKEDVRKFYHEEMGRNVQPKMHMEPGDLQDLHKRTVKAAIIQVKAKTELKKNQKKMLKEWLEGSFHKYKDENDIALNYEEGMEQAIGIDLGTTYCCVAVLVNGKVEIVRNLQGQNTTPSYVRISQQGSEQVVGMVAKDSAHRNAENTIFDAKRMIGRRFEDEKLQNDMNYWPFTVVQGKEGPAIEVFGNQYPPEQIASFLLRQLVTDAEKYLGKTVTKAVITVPAYFTDGQRQATIDAGEMAGLQVLTILNEPTAASIAYKMERFHEDARNVLIFDLGGGTFDVAILKTDAGSIEILAVDGDTHLGGEDFDKAMMQYCATKFQNEHNLDPFKGKDSELKVDRDKAKQRLRRLQTYCEKRKIDLSFARSTTISVDTFQEGTDLEMAISRDTFEDLISPYLAKALEIVGRALETAQLSKAEIEDIVLVGGSTRIPKVQELLSQFFNGKALNHTINPDEAVAYGAAVKAALMNGDQAKKMFNFTTIQDVTPMSLGVEAYVNGVPGHFSAIIPKSSKIPTVILQNYNTLLDNQESVLVKIYQGEAHVAKDNEFLGEFILKGIPPAAAGKELVEVYMDINDMGILHVTAVCKSTKGRETLMVSENKGRLSKGTKEKLLKEAKDTDEAVQRRSYVYSTETGSEKGREYRKRPKSFLSKFLR